MRCSDKVSQVKVQPRLCRPYSPEDQVIFVTDMIILPMTRGILLWHKCNLMSNDKSLRFSSYFLGWF